jgi:hypothetical protein
VITGLKPGEQIPDAITGLRGFGLTWAVLA